MAIEQSLKEKWLKQIDDVIKQGPFEATWDSLENFEIPEWYINAKFGIFIHWGVYSVPAFSNEWYPKTMYTKGSKSYEHHLKTYGTHDKFGYKDFIPMFKAEKFDAKEWAELFQQSGAKFVMPVAEHHDGFQMYDSELSRWNAKQMGPCRDIVGELAEEIRDKGMVFTASSHRAEHNFFFSEGRYFDSDVNDPAYEDLYGPAAPSPWVENHGCDNYFESSPNEEFLDDWLIRTCELIDKYRPEVLWFDWWIMNVAFIPYLKQMAAYYYNRGKEWGLDVAINYKYDAFPKKTAVFDVERGQLSEIRTLFWQTDTATAKNSWGYTEGNSYKEADDIICDLIDIVSKNGALLLNIGPKADGTIPDEDRNILLEIGKWLSVNGEAIYNTRPWTLFGEGPVKVSDGAFTDTKRQKFSSEDIRYTQNENNLYAILMKGPAEGRVVIKSSKLTFKNKALISNMPKAVSVLGKEGNLKFGFYEDGRLWIETPDYSNEKHAVVYKLEF